MLVGMLALILTTTLAASAVRPEGQGSAPPKADAAETRFTQDRERGWHWYEQQPDPPKPEAPKPPAPDAQPTDAPPVMSARWLRQEFEKATEAAISEPTMQNMEYWAYLKKLMLDKSERFADMAMLVTQLNPTLDETIENPVGSMAVRARRDISSRAKQETLKELAQVTSIVYFHRDDCAYCKRMAPVMTRLMKETGVVVTAVAVDGVPVSPEVATSWIPDQGQARMLGVTSTPTLYLFGAREDGERELVRLSIGASTFTDLTTKMLQTARRNDWITQQQLEVALLGAEKRLFLDRVNSSIDWSNPGSALEGLKALDDVAVDRINESEFIGPSTPTQGE